MALTFIDLLASHNCLIVQGNHDYAAATGDVNTGFSQLAKWGIEWTRQILNETQQQWLAQLPPVHRQDEWMAVHGAPMDKRYFFAYVYHMTYAANLDWLEGEGIDFGFHGHSHIQGTYLRAAKQDRKHTELEQSLVQCQAALICPGSVGQPRGGTMQAEYAI